MLSQYLGSMEEQARSKNYYLIQHQPQTLLKVITMVAIFG